MIDRRLQSLIDAIEGRYPEYEVRLKPYESEDDPDLKFFLWILRVPRTELSKVEDFAIDQAFSLYGDDSLPFLVGVATPENTEKYFEIDEEDPPRPSGREQQAEAWDTTTRSSASGTEIDMSMAMLRSDAPGSVERATERVLRVASWSPSSVLGYRIVASWRPQSVVPGGLPASGPGSLAKVRGDAERSTSSGEEVRFKLARKA